MGGGPSARAEGRELDGGPDLGEAADYILAERPSLDEDDVWTVLRELGAPPAPGGDRLALNLVAQLHPRIRRRHVKLILREWRAYTGLAAAEDWEDLDEE